MALNKLLFAIATISLAACGTTKQVEEKKEQPGEVVIPVDADADVIWVNSSKKDCSGTVPIIYFYQTQEGTMQPEGNWDCIYEEIQGFEFEPGYIYQLEVSKVMTEGKPAIALSKIISKERDPNYFRIYDIWAATHVNGEVLEITSTRPNMEINLTTMKVMGKGMCNQYFGKIIQYSPSSIQFGPIAGTKMMCPDIKQETLFLSLLQETISFKIKSMTLYFYNADEKEVLRFQKVD
ncbi:MAG: META domain-containing protein [Crocinitomix sp.]|nr:META domain-containing protein [Crocinitomix sp.]